MAKNKYILVNEFSGNQKGRQVLSQVMQFFSDHHIPYTIWRSEYAGHLPLLTSQIVHRDQEDIELIVIGGDGTLNQVVSTLVKLNRKMPITYFPAGRGNDFNRTWQSTDKINVLLESYLFQREQTFIPLFNLYDKDQHFISSALNSFGFGFDGIVNQQIESWSSDSLLKNIWGGKLSYLLAAISSSFKLPQYQFSFILDKEKYLVQDCQLFCIMNSPFFGGGIRLHSQVQSEAEEISVLAIKDVSTTTVFKLFWDNVILKQDINHQHAQLYKGKALSIFAHHHCIGQIDGELFEYEDFPLEVKISTYPFYLM